MSSIILKNVGKKIFQGITNIQKIKMNLAPQETIEIEAEKAIYFRNSYPKDLIVVNDKKPENTDKWKLSLIPKIAYFYWSNDVLPWIRMMSIVSFHVLNPEWQVILYTSKTKYKGRNTWNTGEQSYNLQAADYFEYMKKEYPAIKVMTFDFNDIGIKSDITEIHKADFLRFYLLSTSGGVWFDSDIMFFKSMNEFNKNKPEYSNKGLWLCFNHVYHSCGFLMSSKNNQFFKEKFELSKKRFNINNYQGVFIDVLDLKEDRLKQYNYENIDMNIVYPINSFNIDLIFNSENSRLFSNNTIGLHWYGGHKLAEKYTNEINENNYNFNNTLCKSIQKYFKHTNGNKFYIITTVKNSEKYINKCIDSVINQTYKNWKMIIVDDCSNDQTVNLIQSYNHKSIKLIANKDSKKKIENIIKAIESCPKSDEDVFVMLDGDDWFSDNNVLNYLDKIYDDNIYITYGQFEPASKNYSNFCKPIDVKTYRNEGILKTSHLKTFKYKLWKNIKTEDFYYKGEVIDHVDDAAFMLPMLEMAGNEHIKFIEKVLYIYNDLNDKCSMYSIGERLEEIKKYIFNKPKYKAINCPSVSILITTFKRTHLLKWNLLSLSRQDLDKYDYEIIILDEYKESKEIIDLIKSFSELNIKYINTGKTKKNYDDWRVPGFAINIGVKQCRGDYIIIACAEIYSTNETIEKIINPLIKDHKSITIPAKAKDDVKSVCLEDLMKSGKIINSLSDHCIPLNVLLPFFMGVCKKEYIDIGGYDERMTGIARDDDCFVGRLLRNGCKYLKVDAEIIHLYHERLYVNRMIDPEINKRVEYNEKIYRENLKVIKVNIGKDWGELK